MWFADISWRQFRRSLGGFSAIVCKQGNDVWAEDQYGKTIAQGEAGVDDAEVIQSALDVGGKVFIAKGTYLLNATLIIKSNTELVGEGRGKTILKIADDANVHAIQNPSTESLENISIAHLTIDGNRNNQTSNGIGISIGYGVAKKNITIRDVEIMNCLSHAIWLDGNPPPKNVLIEGLYVYNCYSGVAGYYHEDVTVRKAYIDTVDWEGIHLTGNSSVSPAYVSKRPHIKDVYIKNAGGNAIDISYTEGAVVKNWVAEDCDRKGVNGEPLCDSDHQDLPNGDMAVIENGIAINCGYSAVYITYGYRTRVRNVFAINCGHRASSDSVFRHGLVFLVEHGVIENCVAYKSNGYGIFLNPNSKLARVLNCYAIENGEHGIAWNEPQYGVIENCVCLNNGQSGTGYNGIHLMGSLASYRTIVRGCYCGDTQSTKTQEYGIYETSTSSSFTGDNIITENILPPIQQKTGTICISGANTIVERNFGHITENSGTATFSGDGSTTDFEIGAHGLVTNEASKIVVKVSPISSDAINASPCVGYVDPADNTKIRVKFSSAPASGSENVKIVWHAEVIS